MEYKIKAALERDNLKQLVQIYCKESVEDFATSFLFVLSSFDEGDHIAYKAIAFLRDLLEENSPKSKNLSALLCSPKFIFELCDLLEAVKTPTACEDIYAVLFDVLKPAGTGEVSLDLDWPVVFETLFSACAKFEEIIGFHIRLVASISFLGNSVRDDLLPFFPRLVNFFRHHSVKSQDTISACARFLQNFTADERRANSVLSIELLQIVLVWATLPPKISSPCVITLRRLMFSSPRSPIFRRTSILNVLLRILDSHDPKKCGEDCCLSYATCDHSSTCPHFCHRTRLSFCLDALSCLIFRDLPQQEPDLPSKLTSLCFDRLSSENPEQDIHEILHTEFIQSNCELFGKIVSSLLKLLSSHEVDDPTIMHRLQSFSLLPLLALSLFDCLFTSFYSNHVIHLMAKYVFSKCDDLTLFGLAILYGITPGAGPDFRKFLLDLCPLLSFRSTTARQPELALRLSSYGSLLTQFLKTKARDAGHLEGVAPSFLMRHPDPYPSQLELSAIFAECHQIKLCINVIKTLLSDENSEQKLISGLVSTALEDLLAVCEQPPMIHDLTSQKSCQILVPLISKVATQFLNAFEVQSFVLRIVGLMCSESAECRHGFMTRGMAAIVLNILDQFAKESDLCSLSLRTLACLTFGPTDSTALQREAVWTPALLDSIIETTLTHRAVEHVPEFGLMCLTHACMVNFDLFLVQPSVNLVSIVLKEFALKSAKIAGEAINLFRNLVWRDPKYLDEAISQDILASVGEVLKTYESHPTEGPRLKRNCRDIMEIGSTMISRQNRPRSAATTSGARTPRPTSAGRFLGGSLRPKSAGSIAAYSASRQASPFVTTPGVDKLATPRKPSVPVFSRKSPNKEKETTEKEKK